MMIMIIILLIIIIIIIIIRSNIQINSLSRIYYSRIETCKIFPNFDLCRTY